MVLWFSAVAVAIVWNVFRDPAFDHRLVAVGAVVPDFVDLIAGRLAAHTLSTSVVVLAAVMAGTVGRRRLRRRLLALPIGMMLHLVLDAAWSDPETFWWPFLGGALDSERIPSLERGLAGGLVLEAIGVVVVFWLWRRFRLAEPDRRAVFVRTGRVGRDLVEGPPPWR